jgi:hypothetical protein
VVLNDDFSGGPGEMPPPIFSSKLPEKSATDNELLFYKGKQIFTVF